MALSNWDCLCINHKGESIDSTFNFGNGISISCYKNWLHIYDEISWDKRSGYVKPMVVNIYEGALVYNRVHILAIRGPQNGVYFVAWKDDWNKKQLKITGVIGCGVYGFSGNRYVGVTKKALRWFSKELNKKENNQGFKYHIYDAPEMFRNMNLLNGTRFNLGDGFFSSNLKTDLQSSKPGKATAPMLIKMLTNS